LFIWRFASSLCGEVIALSRVENMPFIQSDGARLYFELAGSGTPILFLREFSGDLWNWEKFSIFHAAIDALRLTLAATHHPKCRKLLDIRRGELAAIRPSPCHLNLKK